VICQMSPAFSEDNFDQSTPEIHGKALKEFKNLWECEEDQISWFDVFKWDISLPTGRLDEKIDKTSWESLGLFLAGDYTEGRGRVSNALTSGVKVASRLSDFLSSPIKSKI
jgi:predicted NAD/FAD-dependent oxidoreductase